MNTTEQTTKILEEYLEGGFEDEPAPEDVEAFLHATEAVVTLDTLWAMVLSLTPALADMEVTQADKHEIILTAVSQVGNELAAATMFLAGVTDDIPAVLRKMGDNYLKHHDDPVAGAMIKESHDRLADKIEATKKFRLAQKELSLG